MTTVGNNQVIREAFQNLTKIVRGESVTTEPKEYNPQEVKEAYQERYEKLMNEVKQGNFRAVEIPPEVVKYQEALNKETSFTPEQKKSAADLASFIPVIANDNDRSLPLEFKTLLNGKIKDLQEVPNINQNTQDMLIGLADNLAKIPNRPDAGANIFAAKQAMNPETEK